MYVQIERIRDVLKIHSQRKAEGDMRHEEHSVSIEWASIARPDLGIWKVSTSSTLRRKRTKYVMSQPPQTSSIKIYQWYISAPMVKLDSVKASRSSFATARELLEQVTVRLVSLQAWPRLPSAVDTAHRLERSYDVLC